MECGHNYPIEEYVNELDINSWEKISKSTCDRV
jgi:hypothetical protein